jgi:hypothetical protein
VCGAGIAGIAGIAEDEFYLATPDRIFQFDTTAWGAIIWALTAHGRDLAV